MIVTKYVFTHKLSDSKYVLINSLTGAVDVVEEHVVQSFKDIRRNRPHQLLPNEIDELRDRGYLYNEAAEEKVIVDRLLEWIRNYRAETQPLAFVICPTMACNLRCPYCFEPHKLHETSQVMTLEQVEQAFRAVDEIRAKRTDLPRASYNLFGGEPLLPTTKEVVALVVERGRERGLKGSVTTNGTFINQYVEILKPYREDLIFQITMDGVKEIHDQRRITAGGKGTFDQISENIQLYLDEGFNMEVRMNLNDENVDDVPRFLEYVKEQGWQHYENFNIFLSPVTDYTGLGAVGVLPAHEIEARVHKAVPDQLFKDVRVQLNGDFARLNLPVSQALGESLMPGEFMPTMHYCEASGGRFYVFTPDNLVYPCNQIIGDSFWAIGTYSPTLEIEEEKAALWEKRDVSNMPQCMECSVAFLCAGGCPVMATRKIGSPMDSYCGTSKKDLHDYLDTVAPRLLEVGRES